MKTPPFMFRSDAASACRMAILNRIVHILRRTVRERLCDTQRQARLTARVARQQALGVALGFWR